MSSQPRLHPVLHLYFIVPDHGEKNDFLQGFSFSAFFFKTKNLDFLLYVSVLFMKQY